MWRAWVLVALLSDCGSNQNTPTDAPDAPSDGPADSTTAPSSALVVNDGVDIITTWTAPSAYATTMSSGRLFVYNTGSVASAAVAPAISGADAASFSIDAANTTCGMPLAASDGCWLQIAFRPDSAGTKSATLTVDGGDGPVTLTGMAPPGPTTGLSTDVAELDFGLLNKGDAKQLQVLLENAGTTTITLGARTATAPFQYVSDNCAATITPGGACTINISFTSTSLGHLTGTLDIASDANALHVPLGATNLRLIQISARGDGTGTVTSLPAGITCGGMCSAGFPGGIPVMLTASVDGTNAFAHWAGICSGSAATCMIPSPVDGVAVPMFSLASDKQINITFAGTGLAYVEIEKSPGPGLIDTCSTDCTVFVTSGTGVALRGFAASTFVGWTGDCVASTSACSLGTVINDRAVTMTFAVDPHEAATLTPTKPVKGLAVTSTGDVIVGSSVDVSRVAITGTVAWTTTITGGVRGLAVDATDEVFAIGTDTIVKLSATGTIVWSVSLTANVLGYANNPAIAVSPDGTVIAVLTTTGMRVLDGSGGDRFAITNAPNPSSVAVAPDGTIALGEDDVAIGDVVQAARYQPNGTALTAFGPLAGTLHAAVLYTPTNTLCSVTHGENSITASLVNTSGTNMYSVNEPKPLLTGPWLSGVVATPTGECGKISILSQGATDPGLKLDIYSATGAVVHTISKPGVTDSMAASIGVYASSIASGGMNRLAIGGTFVTGGSVQPWIQILDLP